MPRIGDNRSITYDPVAARECHRITVIYAIDHDAAVATEFASDYADLGRPLTDSLAFDRLADCYVNAGRQFPRVVRRQAIAPEALDLEIRHDAAISAVRLWLFAFPHGSIAAGLTVEFESDIYGCIPVMEALHHRRLTLDGQPLWATVAESVEDIEAIPITDSSFGVEVHQLLFIASPSIPALVDRETGAANHAAVADRIYRYRADYRDGDARIRLPPEANRGKTTLAATGPYVAVIAGQQGYVENAFFVSALQMVGASALLRRIRVEVLDELLRLRRLTARRDGDTPRLRTQLAVLSERLGHLELELSFGVEAHESIGSLIPSLRVIDYHRAVFAAADMPDEARTIAAMLDRLARAIHSELEGVRAAERVSDERRRTVVGVTLGFVSLVAVPFGIVFGYFGVATRDVDPDTSLLDLRTYPELYLLLGTIVLAAIGLALIVLAVFRRADSLAARHTHEVVSLDELG